MDSEKTVGGHTLFLFVVWAPALVWWWSFTFLWVFFSPPHRRVEIVQYLKGLVDNPENTYRISAHFGGFSALVWILVLMVVL